MHHLGGDHDLDKETPDRLGDSRIKRAIECDNAAIGADRVAGQRLVPCRPQSLADRGAARVGVLDDCDRRRIILGHQFEGGIRVAIVVVGQLLTLELSRGGDSETGAVGAVKGRRLMRVFAIAQLLRQPAGKDCCLRKINPVLARHPLGDRGVIGSCQGIGLARQGPTHRSADRPAPCRDLGEHRLIISAIGYHRHGIVVLGGGAYQRHSADIDVLDTISSARSRGDGLGKGVQVTQD